MRAQSAWSDRPNAYRAGYELGERIRSVDPEIVFLFSSIDFARSTQLQDGLYDGLGTRKPLVVGGTGDGFHEQDRDGDIGVSAVGIHSEGTLRWATADASNMMEQGRRAIVSCVKKVCAELSPEKPSFYILFADLRADAGIVEAALETHVDAPIVGGFVGDDYSLKQGIVFRNGRALENGMVLAAAAGSAAFDIRIARNLKALGETGTVTRVTANTIHEINRLPAMQFVEKALGRPVLDMDVGVITFLLQRATGDETVTQRAIMGGFGEGDGSASVLGGVRKGDRVRVCVAYPEDILNGAHSCGAESSADAFAPAAAIMFGCAGRKRVLGSSAKREAGEFLRGIRARIPMAGLPSFAEIASMRAGSRYARPVLFNMTTVWLLLGG